MDLIDDDAWAFTWVVDWPLFEPADRLGAGPYVQLWPHRHGTDAMFAAALQVG